MIKILNYFILCAVSLSISFCSKNDYQKQDIAYEGQVPHVFLYQEKEYVLTKYDEVNNNLFDQIGWLINYEDYYKWKEIDKDENVTYAFSLNNDVVRITQDANLKNRWELFSKKNDKLILGLKINNAIYTEKE